MSRDAQFLRGPGEHMPVADIGAEDPRKQGYILLRRRWLIAAIFAGVLPVLLAGSKTPSPAELLGSKAMEEGPGCCPLRFDLVVLDSAPILPVVDSHALAVFCDTVMPVARSGASHGRSVRSAIEMFEHAQGNLAGVVLNDVDLMDPAQSYYYRHYCYEYATYSDERERT
jgi:Mrp family chromosome partitioning ATPase